MNKTIFSAAIAALLAVTLAACAPTGAKEIVLHPATGETDTQTVGDRANIVGDLTLGDIKVEDFDVLIEEKAPGGDWTQFRKFVAHKGSTSIGFALVKTEAGDYEYRATLSGKDFGPYVSAPITIHYKAKN
jgi:hypothetical protein